MIQVDNTDTKVVVITATDVDEVPSVAGRDDDTDPDTAHMVEENDKPSGRGRP